MCNCEDCENAFAKDRLDELARKIHTIYLDLKSGIPRYRKMYSLDDVMAELNEMVGEK